MVTLKQILSANEKLKFLTKKEKDVVRALDLISDQPKFSAGWNSMVQKNQSKHIMLERTWQEMDNKLYTGKDFKTRSKTDAFQKQRKFLRNFEKIKFCHDCIPIRIYYD